MKKLVVFFIIISIIFPASSWAQIDQAQQVQDLSACYDDVFERFKTSYETKTGQQIEVDDELRLQFLKSIVRFKETESYPWKIGSYIIAGMIYAVFELYNYEKLHKYKPIKDILEAESWNSRVTYIQERMADWGKAITAHEEEITRLRNATTAEERAQLLKNRAELARLNQKFSDAQVTLTKGQRLLTAWENEPVSNRWLIATWRSRVTVLSTVALVVLFVALDEVPEALGVYNNLPTSLRELVNVASVYDFEQKLHSNHPDVIVLTAELLEGCRRIQSINLDGWIAHSKGLTADQIISALRDVVVVRDEHPLQVKKK